MTMMTSKELTKNIAKIIKKAEKEVKIIYNEGTLEKPISNDIVLSIRNMAYNEIKMEIKKYKLEKEKEK